MIEVGTGLSIAKTGWSILTSAWRLLRRGHRSLSPSQKVAARQKWKPLFEKDIREKYLGRLRSDVIVRDMRRIDLYPNINDTKGISPWFRVGLLGTYHRGILLVLSGWSLTYDKNLGGLRITDHSANEQIDVKAVLLGSVPYELIEDVDWDGDEYYSYPHIYCFFERKRQPYEKIALYIEHENPSTGNPPYFTEIDDMEGIRARSKRYGIAYYP